jgi:hypothetical protein
MKSKPRFSPGTALSAAALGLSLAACAATTSQAVPVEEPGRCEDLHSFAPACASPAEQDQPLAVAESEHPRAERRRAAAPLRTTAAHLLRTPAPEHAQPPPRPARVPPPRK